MRAQILHRKHLRAAGFTLAEMMVTVAILGIIFSLAPKVMIDTFKFFRLTIARSEIQRDARAALDLINRRLRQAKASTVVVDRLDVNQPPYSHVTFNTISGSTMTFYQEGTQLKMNDGVGSAATLADNLRYLAFTHITSSNENVMSVSVTFEKSVYVGKSKALQTAVEKVRVMNN